MAAKDDKQSTKPPTPNKSGLKPLKLQRVLSKSVSGSATARPSSKDVKHKDDDPVLVDTPSPPPSPTSSRSFPYPPVRENKWPESLRKLAQDELILKLLKQRGGCSDGLGEGESKDGKLGKWRGGTVTHKSHTLKSIYTTFCNNNANPYYIAAQTPGAGFSFFGVPLIGDHHYERLGKQIRVTGLEVCVQAIFDAAGNPTGFSTPAGRFIVIVDKMPIIGTPTVCNATSAFNDINDTASVLMDVGINANAVAGNNYQLACLPYNINTHGTRYHVLIDHKFHPAQVGMAEVIAAGTTTQLTQEKIFKKYVPCDFVMTFSNDTANTVMENELNLAFITDGAGTYGAAGQTWIWIAWTRVFFHDV